MKPEAALKLPKKMCGEYTSREIEEALARWKEEYAAIAAEFPEKQKLCQFFIVRAERAADYADSRCRRRERGTNSVDEEFRPHMAEEEAKENESLNGDFPLGNDFDAEFAVNYFSVAQLARIHCGLADTLEIEEYCEPNYSVLMKKGMLAELKGDWAEAERCYEGVPFGNAAIGRGDYCRKRRERESR